MWPADSERHSLMRWSLWRSSWASAGANSFGCESRGHARTTVKRLQQISFSNLWNSFLKVRFIHWSINLQPRPFTPPTAPAVECQNPEPVRTTCPYNTLYHESILKAWQSCVNHASGFYGYWFMKHPTKHFSSLFIFSTMVLEAWEVQAFALDPSEQLHMKQGPHTSLTLRMVTFSLLISRAVSKHALTPLEILLLKVRRMQFDSLKLVKPWRIFKTWTCKQCKNM